MTPRELRLTYAQLAARLRISGEAARQLVRRRQWRRIQPNRTGAPAIIVVPDEELAAESWRQDRPTLPDIGDTEADKPPSPPNGAAVLDQFEHERTAFKGQIDALRGENQALADLVAEVRSERERERQRAEQAFCTIDGLKAEKDREAARADRTEQALIGERARSNALRDRLDTLEAGAREAQQAAEVQQDRLRAEVDSARAELAEARRAEDERKGRGRWARLRTAWRGE
jgi:hypothetical protein